ncbi:MAG: winged helix-turn-helix domain-containing protein [Acidobacteriia bacterium]|nr:winged helix-turn-helix domain-containing protein [Terriglobia bacterium]
MPNPERYEFGEFTLDAAERRLYKGSQAVPLQPKAHDVLLALVRRAGRLVTKRELLELVWPESFVEEGILAVYISGLRKAFGKGEESRRFIETVPGSGYRFVGAVALPNVNRQESAAQQPRPRPEVHEMIGRGRSHLLAMSMFDVPKAVKAFRTAIELDPTYAAAHAGLALACCAQVQMRLVPPAEAYSEAKAAALSALAMDSGCADAQVALGAVLFFSEWNWAGAKRSLERALELNPNHTEAYLLHGQLLEALGRLEEGLAMKQKALERDPFSPLVHLQISMSYWNQHRYEESIEWANKTLALDPRHPHAREHIAGAYLKMGDFDRYMAESIQHAELHGCSAEALEPLKQAYATSGRAGVVKLFLQRASSRPSAFPAMALAVHYGEAGNLDAAFKYLDRALESHDPSLVHLAVAPQWDSLRVDPRFTERLARMGLSTVSLLTA